MKTVCKNLVVAFYIHSSLTHLLYTCMQLSKNIFSYSLKLSKCIKTILTRENEMINPNIGHDLNKRKKFTALLVAF